MLSKRNESETRRDLIDPALLQNGWNDALIKREETAPTVDIIDGKAVRRKKGRTDYTLRIRLNETSQPIAIALIEAKTESDSPSKGLEQAKSYADCKRLNVKFIYSSNGHQFVEFNRFTRETSSPKPMSEFPSPDDLRRKYEFHMGFGLADTVAKPLSSKYKGGEDARRYYQDAAIRAVLEKIAQCKTKKEPSRVLLSLATGAGKTFIAVHLLHKIATAGDMRKALFICDRDELRSQGLNAFKNIFGSDTAEVYKTGDNRNNAKNAKIHIATYQTLGIDKKEEDNDEISESFLNQFYSENEFSHIIIDECHRSAWGKWSEILKKNPDAVQVGLTATPRQLIDDNKNDSEISANNFKYFGEPVYEYDISQGIEDGYLAACEILKGRVNIDDTGLTLAQIIKLKPKDYITGRLLSEKELKDIYEKNDYEGKILLPDRVAAMCKDLFDYLCESGKPEQKTVIFCTRDTHCDLVVAELERIYKKYCDENNREPKEHFAFKCTTAGGSENLQTFKGNPERYFIAATVDLLSTGVDIPRLQNVVFFRYLKSAITFYQMVGRGTRLDPESNKLMFRVYDYTNCTRLFGKEFLSKLTKEKSDKKTGGGGGDPEPVILPYVEGFDDILVHYVDHQMLITEEGKAKPVSIDIYKQRVVDVLVHSSETVEFFRKTWIEPQERKSLMERLPSNGKSALVVQKLTNMSDFDLFDVLAELGYHTEPQTRKGRVSNFLAHNKDWLLAFPKRTSSVLQEILNQFIKGGTEILESGYLFQVPEINRAGGIIGLKESGLAPRELLQETKWKLFTV